MAGVCAWLWGICGRWACMARGVYIHGKRVCMAEGACMVGVCMVGEHVWQGVCMVGGAWSGVHGRGELKSIVKVAYKVRWLHPLDSF